VYETCEKTGEYIGKQQNHDMTESHGNSFRVMSEVKIAFIIA